jgi:hypothetical protein
MFAIQRSLARRPGYRPTTPLITRTAKPTSLPVGGGLVTYTYMLTNPVQVALSNVTVTDDKCSPVIFNSGDTNTNSLLETSETWTYSCTTTVTVTTTDTAVATGHANGQT